MLATILAAVALSTGPAQEAQVQPPPPPPSHHEVMLALDDVVEFLTVLGGPEAIEFQLRDAASEFGVSGDLVVRIARCESGLNPKAYNRSGASGLGQHLARYYPARARSVGYDEPRIDPFRPRQNARVTAWLLATSGTRPWNPSRHCWN